MAPLTRELTSFTSGDDAHLDQCGWSFSIALSFSITLHWIMLHVSVYQCSPIIERPHMCLKDYEWENMCLSDHRSFDVTLYQRLPWRLHILNGSEMQWVIRCDWRSTSASGLWKHTVSFSTQTSFSVQNYHVNLLNLNTGSLGF